MPGNTSTSADLGTIPPSGIAKRVRSRSAIEAGRTRADRTGACFPRAPRGGPNATVRTYANESLPPRAAGAARPSLAPQRAPSSSAACPETRRPQPTLARSPRRGSRSASDHDLRLRLGPQELTAQARAFHGHRAEVRTPPSEPTQTKVSHRAPQAPRVPLSRPSARQAAQPHARKHVDLSRPWHDPPVGDREARQITICD